MMEQKKHTGKGLRYFCISLFAAFFFLPHFLKLTDLGDFKKLNGSFGTQKKPHITFKSWFSGDFQEQYGEYYNDSFGLSPPMVRFANQIDFSLFKQPNTRYVVIGKQNVLYESAYIDAALGLDFLGSDSIQKIANELQLIRQKLRKQNTELLVVFAPGKGSMYPEQIPEYYLQFKSNEINLTEFKSAFSKANIPFLDFNSWFISMKDTSPYSLMPKNGIHWSTYGMCLAADSMLRYLGAITQKDLPIWQFTATGPTTEAIKSDDDIEKGLNLIVDLPNDVMTHPKIEIIDSTKSKLKVAVISDSYFWSIYDAGFCSRATDEGQFWYYNKQVYPQYFSTGTMVHDLDLKKALSENDVIIILQTDATLPRFGFGFIKQALSALE
jgi:hypothetical protein